MFSKKKNTVANFEGGEPDFSNNSMFNCKSIPTNFSQRIPKFLHEQKL